MKVDFNLTNDESDKQISVFLFEILGNRYQVAHTDASYYHQADPENLVINNTLYQLMPINAADPFFNWYCYVRREHQYYANRTECLQNFIKYYVRWISKGKPDWKREMAEEAGVIPEI